MSLWKVKFDHKNGEQRECKECGASFHTMKPRHRWINKVKKLNRVKYVGDIVHDDPFEEYDYELDEGIDKAHQEVLQELKRLERTKLWTSAKLYSMYWCDSDDTLQELADKIGISKSTCFIAIKKIRKHLEKVINNPFQ